MYLHYLRSICDERRSCGINGRWFCVPVRLSPTQFEARLKARLALVTTLTNSCDRWQIIRSDTQCESPAYEPVYRGHAGPLDSQGLRKRILLLLEPEAGSDTWGARLGEPTTVPSRVSFTAIFYRSAHWVSWQTQPLPVHRRTSRFKYRAIGLLSMQPCWRASAWYWPTGSGFATGEKVPAYHGSTGVSCPEREPLWLSQSCSVPECPDGNQLPAWATAGVVVGCGTP